MDKPTVDQVIATAAAVVASGAISANGHGNVSIRVPGPDSDEICFSSAPTLRGLSADGIVSLGLDGELREGSLQPIQGAVVAMHTALYARDPSVGCVLHTHAPYATAFAAAQRPIDCWIEAMAMFGLADGVPVAAYAPRGSDEAVAAILAALRPRVPAVLLANHGLLVFHRTPELAVLAAGVIEETAQVALHAAALGGAIPLPPAMRAAALQRTMAFAAAGTLTR